MRSKQSLLFLGIAFLCAVQATPAQTGAARSGGTQTGESAGGSAKTPAAPAGQVKLDLPGVDTSLWFRYFQAGEDATVTHHDADLAKKYYMAALAELEKHPPARGTDIWLSIKLSSLEYGLMHSYPKEWPKSDSESDETMKLRKEQVDTYYRIARINEYFAPPDDLLRTKAKERYEKVRKSYEQAVAQIKQQQPKPAESDQTQ